MHSEDQILEIQDILGSPKIPKDSQTSFDNFLKFIGFLLVFATFAAPPFTAWQTQAITSKSIRTIHGYLDTVAKLTNNAQSARAGKIPKENTDKVVSAEEYAESNERSAAAIKKNADDEYLNEQDRLTAEFKSVMDYYVDLYVIIFLAVFVTMGAYAFVDRRRRKARKIAQKAAFCIYEELQGYVDRPTLPEITRIVQLHIPKKLNKDVPSKAKRIDWFIFGRRPFIVGASSGSETRQIPPDATATEAD